MQTFGHIVICLVSGFAFKICIIFVGLEVLTVVSTKKTFFWVVPLCSLEKT
jgi:hypothetical protein